MHFAKGDRVRVAIDKPHMKGQSAGRIAIVNPGPAYGVIFDGMEEMGVHKWYVGNEMEEADSDDDAPPKKSESMNMSATAARPAPFYLFAATAEARPAVTLGQAYPKTRNGLSASYYWRPVIADGDYVHPMKHFRLSVDAKRRKTWEDNFRRMAQHGEEVPVVEDHADDKSRATLGYVVDVRQNGKWYEELHQYLGDESRDVALKNKISVGIDPAFRTGTGVELGDCIVHSATTCRPVVPGQGEAVLAASRGPASDVLALSAAPLQESDMDLTALRKAIGAVDTVPDADVISHAAGKLAVIPTLENERDTARTELSRRPAGESEFPAAIAKGSVNNLHRTVELMAREGSLSAAQATAAKELIGTADKPNVLALSRTGADHPAEKWLEVLALGATGVKADGSPLTDVQELSRPSHDHSAVTDPNAAATAKATAAAAKLEEDAAKYAKSLNRKVAVA